MLDNSKGLNKAMTEASARITGTRYCSNCHISRREEGGARVPYASAPNRTRWICRDCVERLAALRAGRT